MNQYESFSMMGAFSAAGFTIVEPEDTADVYVINSCTVTAAGDRKSLKALRKFRRQAPGAVIVLCGCMPQAFPEKASGLDEADIIMGSKNRSAVLDAAVKRLSGGGRLVDIPAHQTGEAFEKTNTPAHSERTRAFLKIEDGCERDCAYCIIPKARGPVRSKLPGDIRAELTQLTGAGYREVVLTGVNLSCYGQDLGVHLNDAIEAACQSGIERVRLGSLEPDLISTDDCARWAQVGAGVLCPQFHLSLQSGCDRTLNSMNRRYSADDYRSTVKALRRYFPGCAVTTDVMVGFPNEREEDHAASLNFIREIGFAKAHVFAYSPRPGTAAAEMAGQIPGQVASRRAREMAETTDTSRQTFLQSRIGQTYSVLFETLEESGLYSGYTPCYTPVAVSAGRDVRGKVLPVLITEQSKDGCIGVLVD
ncbi:MAG: MiaB/RimO family radical SAM methylthiotransferase [Oscillospiraceae bacterium]|nr:MiaB/RimO family radical SAM methylthiotransferase [Oscillospiraceae bacterium]